MKAFEIYKAARGYVAVTNPTRRRILQSLAQADADLPQLVRLTAKAKPTLSSVHMKALLEDGLVEEYPHPSDARRKYYRLTARRIGVSDIPLDELRGAVKEYTRRDSREPSVPLGATLDLVTSEGIPREILERNARSVGAEASSYVDAGTLKDTLPRIATILENAGIARPQRVDFDANEIELELLAKAPKNARMLAVTIAAFFEGILRATAHASARATGTLAPGNRVVVVITLLGSNVSSLRNIQEAP